MHHRRLWQALTRSRIPFIPLLVIAALAAAGGASAQSDSFCIGWDDPNDPSWGCVTISAFVPTNIYLCLRNPTGDQVLSWEARITHDNADCMIGAWTVGGVDADPDAEDFVVDCSGSPLLPGPQGIVVLGSMQVIVLDASERIEFFIGPVPGSTAFPDGTPGYSHTVGVATPATVCSG
ncbi:hypothetical protein HGA89_00800, partial [bacterium]|nr:hypothetical protein [bacterium]